MQKTHYILLFLLCCSIIVSCTDPYELDSEFFEENIVIEAIVTNRLEKQTIKVSKTYPIDSTTFQPANNNVTVKIKEEQGPEYSFSYRAADSTFVSDQAFQAQPNINYSLEVTTANDVYKATSMFKNEVDLGSITVSKGTSKEGVEGLDINVNSQDSGENDKYFRYKYEETFKITAPYYSPYKAILTEVPLEYPQFNVFDHLVVRAYDDEIYHDVCYRTEYAKNPILVKTNNFTGDDLENYALKFIPKTDYKINDRYSIKITQYSHSLEAYTFYKTLQDMNLDNEILSPNQPGFVQGNIKSVNSPNKKVIGFFDTAPTSTKRIFLNRADYFAGEPIPEYFRECNVQDFDKLQPPNSASEDGINEGVRLIEIVANNTLIYYDSYRYYDANIGNQNFLMVKPECGDCAVLGSPEPPEFWEEE